MDRVSDTRAEEHGDEPRKSRRVADFWIVALVVAWAGFAGWLVYQGLMLLGR